MGEMIPTLLAHRATLKSDRQTWDQTYQELADVLLPRRADFTVQTTPGDNRMDSVYDSVPMQARRGLATAIDSLFTPRNVQWFHGGHHDDDVNQNEAAREWYDAVDRKMFKAVYGRKSRFIQRKGELENDLVTFGTGVLYIGESELDPGRPIFKTYHLRDCLIDVDEDGTVDTIYITLNYTPQQAASAFGGDQLSEQTRKDLTENKRDKREFVWCVKPRKYYDTALSGPENMPYASVVIEVKEEHKVEESGYAEFPFAVPRWDTSSGEKYGRSPGMIALPDAETLQSMGKTLLVAGQRAVDPPMWALSDGIMSAPRTFPGGMTYIDGSAARSFGRVPMGELSSTAQIPLGLEMQNATRENVWAAFFRNVMQLPVQGPRMSATEVIERKEEMLRAMGPVFGQLETDYLAVVVERVFGIMQRAGLLPPAPDIVVNSDIVFQFESPILRARHQIEAAGLAQMLELSAPLLNNDPSLLDNFDADAIMRDGPLIGGFPQRWMRTIDERDRLREDRAKAAEAQQQLEQAAQVAQMARDAGPMVQEMVGGGEQAPA